MPIPNAASEGFARLRIRVAESLNYNRESPAVEFKESMPWPDVKMKLVKAALGMANLRDGGLFIIGRGKAPDRPEGVTDEHLASYDSDIIRDVVDSYRRQQFRSSRPQLT